MGFFAINNTSDNLTYCATTGGIFLNLTNSYSAQINETSAFSASVVMFLLAALFFNLNLFSGLSDVSAILDPKVRVFLSSALSLFLPVMSYLFSEAKNAETDAIELPLRARLILIWMLLVELLRKKVEEIRYTQGYAGTFERVGRVIWLGSLVFSNLQGPGRKAMVGILWLICLTKLGQRIAYTEVGKRSFAFGKNARLITSYMAQVLEKDQHEYHRQEDDDGDQLLETCKYVVMEEENLVVQAIPGGYKLIDDVDGTGGAATVGKIWEVVKRDPLLSSLDRDQRLRWLCLSFALFKLFRRRFEHQPAMTALETRSYRELIVKGLYPRGGDEEQRRKAAEALFQVTSDELKFLSEYYHSVVPVVLASPFFLLANYFLLPLLVVILCLVAIILCGNGDISYAIHSIKTDNYTTFITFFNVEAMVRCLGKVLKSPLVFLCAIDMSITTLLFLMFVYEEVWEFFVVLLSDWFVVSLLCKYCTARPHWHGNRAFRWAIRCLLWARSMLSPPAMSFNQFCVLRFCWVTMPALFPVTLPILLPNVVVPVQVKHSIMEYFTKTLHDLDGKYDADDLVTLSNGSHALKNHVELLPFCESDNIAEVILVWHIATSLLEVKYPPQGSNMVATSLSKYCAYLVAFHPELLPDNPDSTERVFQDMKGELSKALGFWCYYFSSWSRRSRYGKIMGFTEKLSKMETVVEKGAAVGRMLEKIVKLERSSSSTLERSSSSTLERSSSSAGREMWDVLSDLWVELVVYVAPSSDESCLAGHENVLPKGGEFITVLWALATHTGVSRPATAPPVAVPIQRVEGLTPDDACV